MVIRNIRVMCRLGCDVGDGCKCIVGEGGVVEGMGLIVEDGLIG